MNQVRTFERAIQYYFASFLVIWASMTFVPSSPKINDSFSSISASECSRVSFSRSSPFFCNSRIVASFIEGPNTSRVVVRASHNLLLEIGFLLKSLSSNGYQSLIIYDSVFFTEQVNYIRTPFQRNGGRHYHYWNERIVAFSPPMKIGPRPSVLKKRI